MIIRDEPNIKLLGYQARLGTELAIPLLQDIITRYLVEHQARLDTEFIIRLKTEYMTRPAWPVTEINIVPDTWYKNGRISGTSLVIIYELIFFQNFSKQCMFVSALLVGDYVSMCEIFAEIW